MTRKHKTTLWLTVILLLVCTGRSAAVPENQLSAAFDAVIWPFYNNQFSFGYLRGSGGVKIHYAKREVADERGALIVVNGRTEFAAKYAELFYDLRGSRFSFYTYDQRGQGLSGRLLKGPQKGYVACFANYVDDLAKFISTVVRPRHHRRLFILTHSMGGLAAVLYCQRSQIHLNGLILCAPMLQINTSPIPNRLARYIAQGVTAIGGGPWYVFGSGPYDPAKPFKGNDLTHSLVRFNLNKRLIARDPRNALGGPTFKWLAASFKGMSQAMKGAGGLHMPILLLRGSEDSVVGREGEDIFCRQAPVCRLVELAGGRHELLMEKDSVRNRALVLIKIFLKNH